MSATVGSKVEVWNGSAKRTAGGLTKKDLMKNPKSGKVVSKKQYKRGMELYKKMKKEGKLAKPFSKKRSSKKSKRKSKRKKSKRKKSKRKSYKKPLFADFFKN